MGQDKNRRPKRSGRDGGPFLALPWAVLDSEAYKSLGHPARSLLIEIARQHGRDNNGRLLTSFKYLFKRGWKSSDVIHRAKKELIEKGLIFETVKGHRPNKASWYAITWHDLDRHPGYDVGILEAWRDARGGYAKMTRLKITAVNPREGVRNARTAPLNGVTAPTANPPEGAIEGSCAYLATPLHGNHLDMPSATP